MSNARASLLKSQIEESAGVFMHLISDLPDEVLHDVPAGVANSIAGTIGHVVAGMDGLVNGMLRQQAPLSVMMAHGFSELPPSGDDLFNWYEYGTRVRVNLAETLPYAKAVFESFGEYLDSVDDAALAQTVPLPGGERSIEWVMSAIVLSNILEHSGEISALKGLHGLKGYYM